MSTLIRIIFALQICIAFVAGCAVDDDSAADTELSVSSDVADPGASEAVATPDGAEAALDGADDAATVDSLTGARAPLCTRFRLDNRATAATCRNLCSSRGQTALGFDNQNKICRCCSPGPI